MHRLGNIAICDYQESVTTGQTDRQPDGQTPEKGIPMCGYALQATQNCSKECMCHLGNITICDYQESVTTGQIDRHM